MEDSGISSRSSTRRSKSWLVIYSREFKDRAMIPSVWLLVFYSIILGLTVEVGFSIPVMLVTALEDSSCYYPAPESLLNPTFLFILQNSLFCILYPFTGWFSDIVIGRKKALSVSLWLCWLGILLQCISYCIQYGSCGTPVNIAKYGVSGIAFVVIMVGNAGLFTNIPSFGIDQLFDKPHTQSQAFLYWSVWGVFLGFTVGYIGFVPSSSTHSLLIQLTALVIFSLATLAVVLHINTSHLLQTVEYNEKNPYLLVYSVLKYTLLHKVPEKRSSLTYWEDALPSRMDLGKCKYGGPFLEKDVENVKAFFRIVVVFICTFGFYIPYYHALIGVIPYINRYEGALTTLDGYGSFVLWESFDSSIVLLVPFFLFLIIPCLPKLQYFIERPLVGFVWCYVFQMLSLISMILLEYFRSNEHKHISFLYFSFPLFFSGLSDALTLVFGLELISSQAPSSMKGMLIGFYWFIRTIFTDIGACLSFIHDFTAGYWIFIIQTIISLIGLVCFVLTVRWYKNRKQDDTYDLHFQVETAYERSLTVQKSQTSTTAVAPDVVVDYSA